MSRGRAGRGSASEEETASRTSRSEARGAGSIVGRGRKAERRVTREGREGRPARMDWMSSRVEGRGRWSVLQERGEGAEGREGGGWRRGMAVRRVRCQLSVR